MEITKVKREPKVKKEPGEPKVKKEPKEPKQVRVKKEKKEDSDDSGAPASLAQRLKNKRKSGPPKKSPKKNPWETDSEDENELSDISVVSDGEVSDDDFEQTSKKVKTNGTSGGASATVKIEMDSSLGNVFFL